MFLLCTLHIYRDAAPLEGILGFFCVLLDCFHFTRGRTDVGIPQALHRHLFATGWAVDSDPVGLPAGWRRGVLFLLGVRMGVLLHAFSLAVKIQADLYALFVAQ